MKTKLFSFLATVLLCVNGVSAQTVLDMQGLLRGPRYHPYAYPASEYVYYIQVSTDELAIPIRTGGDWKDGYAYQDLQKHTWKPDNHIILSAWNYCYDIINGCNQELKKAIVGQAQAEVRLLRAYAYYRLLDLFGNVPLIVENTVGIPVNSSRRQIYDFVDSELNSPIMNNLPASGLMNKGVLNTLKARLYLNAQAFVGEAHWNECIAACNEVISSGKYSLENNIFANFYVDNENSSENIFTIKYNSMEGTVGNYLQCVSHSQRAGDIFGIALLNNCVNGITINPGKTKDDANATYNIFQPNDIRRFSMITGPKDAAGNYLPLKNKATGEDIYILSVPINYDPFYTGGFSEWNSAADNANAARRGDGARLIKYEMVPNMWWEMDNDWVVMRYAEVLYMKAECLIRLGRASEAVPIFQQVLSKRGYDGGEISIDQYASKRTLTPASLTNIIPAVPDLDFMEKEWRREFVLEDRRRTDMIRFGKFTTETWGGHLTATNDATRNLFPIPQAVLDENTHLYQNPGYGGNEFTSVTNVTISQTKISAINRNIVVENAPNGSTIQIYSIVGQNIASKKANENTVKIPVLQSGIYIVSAGGITEKVFVP